MIETVSSFFGEIFLRNAVAASLLASFVCGISGTFVTMKRIGFISGGIAHAILGGVGFALYLGIAPLAGAVLSALIFSVLLGLIKEKGSQNEDTIVGALWAMGMSVGIVFMHMTPGYGVDLMSYLFGNILMVSRQDLQFLFAIDIVVLVTVFIFFRQFVAVCFDEEYALLRGVRSGIIYTLLLSVIALTIVSLMQVVGLILVIALLTLPGAVSAMVVREPLPMMVFSVVLGAFFTLSGLVISYGTNLPAGSVIILFSSFCYLGALCVKGIFERIRRDGR